MNDFKRECRYFVLKHADMSQCLYPHEIEQLRAIYDKVQENRRINRKQPFKAVVVESDWSEYEMVWTAIEKRVTA